MIAIKIAGAERCWDALREVEESWLNQQLRRHRPDQPTCIVIRIDRHPVNIVLTTPGCGAGASGWRRPNEVEEKIIALWQEWVLQAKDGMNLIAFLRQLGRVL